MGFFDSVKLAPPDAIFGLTATFNADPRPEKVNLSVGVFKTEDLKTPVLKCVKAAEEELLLSEKNKEYLPIEGNKHYLEKVGELIFQEPLWKEISAKTVAAQTIGGTGALSLGGHFLKQEVTEHLYFSEPTWPNHRGIITACDLLGAPYPYYNVKTHQLEFDRLVEFLQKLEPKRAVLLHASCHNPTGADLTLEQWEILSDIFLEKKLVPFFDLAYQGFGKGLDEDAMGVRLFAERGHEMLIAASFSKNFSLYSERVGALYIITGSVEDAKNVLSQIKILIRTNYSNPSRHGSSIVGVILNNHGLKQIWESELKEMRDRVITMRNLFTDKLMQKDKRFQFLKDRVGMFCFCGLEKKQVDRLISEYGIYMTGDGRVNVAGLNKSNIDYVVNSILAVSNT